MKKKIIRNIIIVLVLLLIPLGLTLRDGNVEGVGWNWGPEDFIFAFVFLVGASSLYEFTAHRLTKPSHRMIAAAVIAFVAVIIWVQLATGGIVRAVSAFLN